MKQLPIIILGLFVMSLFFMYGCENDNHYYNRVTPIASVTKDSLVGSAWLQNSNGDTTNVFEKGEDIYIYTSLRNLKQKMIFAHFKKNSLKIYREENDLFIGYPQRGMDDLIDPIWLIHPKETKKELIFVPEGMIEKETILPKGKYYMKVEIYATLYDLDTLNMSNIYDHVIEKDTFSNMKIEFKIK